MAVIKKPFVLRTLERLSDRALIAALLISLASVPAAGWVLQKSRVAEMSRLTAAQIAGAHRAAPECPAVLPYRG